MQWDQVKIKLASIAGNKFVCYGAESEFLSHLKSVWPCWGEGGKTKAGGGLWFAAVCSTGCSPDRSVNDCGYNLTFGVVM